MPSQTPVARAVLCAALALIACPAQPADQVPDAVDAGPAPSTRRDATRADVSLDYLDADTVATVPGTDAADVMAAQADGGAEEPRPEPVDAGESGGDACSETVCDPETGDCVFVVWPGADCDDGLPCTHSDECDSSGQCAGVPDCDDGNPCTVDHCTAHADCVHVSHHGTACVLGDVCWVEGVCKHGSCNVGPNPCQDDNWCTDHDCIANSDGKIRCVTKPLVGKACDGWNPCLVGEVCNVFGECHGFLYPCDDGNQCTVGDCGLDFVGDRQCTFTDLGEVPCEDGSPCTVDDQCDGAGACLGSAVVSEECACEVAKPVDALPYQNSGTTTLLTDLHGTTLEEGPCEGLPTDAGVGAPEAVYRFAPPSHGVYTLSVTSTEFNVALYVVTGCGESPTQSCIAGVDAHPAGNVAEGLVVVLTGGVEVFVVVDGVTPSDHGAYSLTVSGEPTSGATEPAPGCEAPVVVGELPFLHGGTTAGASDDHSADSFDFISCPGSAYGAGTGAGDAVYSFTPLISGSYTITVESGEFDAVWYVVKSCGGYDAVGCIAGLSAPFPEELVVELFAYNEVWLVIDGRDPGDAGMFGLQIDGPG